MLLRLLQPVQRVVAPGQQLLYSPKNLFPRALNPDGPPRRCYFAFCSLCNESWHPASSCVSLETQLAIMRQRLAGRRDDVEALRRKEGEMMSLARIKVRLPRPARP